MTDKPSQKPSDFIAAVYGQAGGNVFVCALPNERGGHREFHVATRDRLSIDGFVEKRDRAGSAVYYCTGTLKPGAQPLTQHGSVRCKDNVAWIVGLYSDTDLKSVTIDRAGIVSALLGLMMPPSVIVWSGRGAQGLWLFNEPIEATPENIERIETLNALLSDVVAGDPIQDVCRLLRLPGSHNTKGGGWLDVEVVHARYEPRYEIDDLDEWLSWASPAIRRKESEARRATRSEPDNPYLRIAAQQGFKLPIDVEKRLAEMTYQGVGETSIHNTQLAVSASLLNQGEDIEDVVVLLLDATRAAAGADGARWRWDREERTIRRMCQDWQRKHPEKKARPRAQARGTERDEAIHEETERREATTGAVVHHIAEERQKRERSEKGSTRQSKAKGKAAAPNIVADGVIEAIRQQGGDLALTEGEIWLYEAGVWTMTTPAETQWLRTLIQTGCDELGYPGDTKVANAAWKRLTEHPALHRRKIEWDAGSIVATTNGLLDLKTRALGPFRADAWCRSKIGQPFEPGATCRVWEQFLDGCFRNLGAGERRAVIAALQEAFGAFLAIKLLTREQRKALFLLGPSRTGKTQVSTVAQRLIGEPIASPSIADISTQFGMQTLRGARAWIRDDAVSEQDKIDPARFKALVTGEAVQVDLKRVDPARIPFTIPVVLTTNAMPRARDSSDAIYNRALVIEMTNVVEEHEAGPMREVLGLPRDRSVGDAIADREGPGLLNWSLDGLDRLLTRGRYDPPKTMRDAVKRFKDDNNPVAAWISVSVEPDPDAKVSRNDLRCSFNGWQREEMGGEARAWGGRQFFPQVRSLAPYASTDGEQAHDGERFVIGLRLTETGLRFWEDHHAEPLSNGTKGYSALASQVNRDRENKTEF